MKQLDEKLFCAEREGERKAFVTTHNEQLQEVQDCFHFLFNLFKSVRSPGLLPLPIQPVLECTGKLGLYKSQKTIIKFKILDSGHGP
jgi:hypothetical protein